MKEQRHKNKDQEITERLLQVERKAVFDMDLVEVLSKDPSERTSEEEEEAKRVRNEFGDHLYSKLIWTISQKAYEPSKAKRLWTDILVHKRQLRDKLGRDVGLTVATLDYMVNVAQEMVKPKLLEEQDMEKIAETALVDELTGLYLRGVFDVLLEKIIREGIRYDHPVSLIMADIDDFKLVNDRFGHGKGDDALRRIGRIFLQNVRDADVPARYGGEEFAVILPETEENSSYELAERLRALVEDEFNNNISLTLSLGIASSPRQAHSTSELKRASDKALYRAKLKGKNCVVTATPRSG
jgi:diguanylate cyclase (GGDEF)-like protein